MEVSGQLCARAALPLGNNLVPIDWETGWVSELVMTVLENRQSLAPFHNCLHRHTVRLCSFCMVYPIVTITSNSIFAVLKMRKLAQVTTLVT